MSNHCFDLSTVLTRLVLTLMLFLSTSVRDINADANTAADDAYARGMAWQQQNQSTKAIAAYKQALALEPDHARAHYEIGWSYWSLRQWDKVIEHWQRAKQLHAPYPGLDDFLRAAEENASGQGEPLVRVPIGTTSRTATTPRAARQIRLTLVARFQHYNPAPTHTADHFDPYIFSPKSVRFDATGRKAYVNALEGYSTVIFDADRFTRIDRILHRFGQAQEALFGEKESGPVWVNYPPGSAPEHPNRFTGKPVESALSADGRFLWVPYYRRDFDTYGTLPSAIAVIDTASDKIVRIMDTGPIPKYVATSPDGTWVAVTHWGDNTVGLINTRDPDPRHYRRDALIVIGQRPDLSKIDDTDRDHHCGYCLRGTVFTPDSHYLLVGRMGGGGISVIDVERRKYIGTVYGMRPTPRHLVLSPDGQYLYVSSSLSGYVARYRTDDLVAAAKNRQRELKPLNEGESGPATRTIDISPDGKLVFAAVNLVSRLAVLDADTLKPLVSIPVDSYPVGLAVSPDGRHVWVTSQGRELRGGNSVSVYRISDD